MARSLPLADVRVGALAWADICVVRVRSGKSVDYDLRSEKAVQMACGALETAVKAGFCKKRLRKAVQSHEISADTRAALLEALLVSGPKISTWMVTTARRMKTKTWRK